MSDNRKARSTSLAMKRLVHPLPSARWPSSCTFGLSWLANVSRLPVAFRRPGARGVVGGPLACCPG